MKILILILLFNLVSCSTTKRVVTKNKHTEIFKNQTIANSHDNEVDKMILNKIRSCLYKKDYDDFVEKIQIHKKTHEINYIGSKIKYIGIKHEMSLLSPDGHYVKLEQQTNDFRLFKGQKDFFILVNHESLHNAVAQWIVEYSQSYNKVINSPCGLVKDYLAWSPAKNYVTGKLWK